MADEYARAVVEAARLDRRTVARLVNEMSTAEGLVDVERIEADLTTTQNQYEAILMTETIAVQARNDQLEARLSTLEKRQRQAPS